MSSEEAVARFAALEAHVAQITAALTASQAEHTRVHNELQRTQQMASHSTPKNEFRLIDPKTMAPEKFGQSPEPTWLDWSENTRSYIENMDQEVANALKAVENREAPVLQAEFDSFLLADSHTAQLRRYLKLRTQGNAKTIIKAAQADKLNVLEQWRRLSWEYDPIGLGTELIELQDLMSPERLRAKSLAGISAAIESWENLERRHRDRQGIILPDKIRISVLFKLVPSSLADEILKQTTKWSSYTQLKEHLHSIQFLRTKGPAPMNCANLEEESPEEDSEASLPDTFTNEEGDLLRLEKRDGKRIAVRVPSSQQRGSKPQSKEKECFRCGRKGHIRPSCNWSTHLDGGPPRPPPAPKAKKGTNNLEEQTESGPLNLASLDLCTLELAPVSDNEDEDEDEWTDWNQDPWLLGRDPWTGRGTSPQHQSPQGSWCQPTPQSPPTGKDLLANLFKIRPKCTLCEQAGVYEQVAHQLEQSSLQVPPPPVPPAWHAVRAPRKPDPTQLQASLASSPILDSKFQASLASSPILDPSYPPARASSKRCDSKTSLVQVPKYVIPSSPMPDKPPPQAPSAIWLSSCVPDTQPEVLEWDPSEPPPLTSDQDDHRELQSVLLEENQALCAICQGTGLLLREACPLCDGQRPEPSLVEINAVEINTVHNPDDDLLEIIVDSGAGESVAAHKHLPQCPLVDSPGSLAGQKYLGPGGEEIPNMGQFTAMMTIEGEREGKFTFQAAPVRKPLLAVSSVNDKGNLVVFDGDASFIIPGTGPQVAQLRKLIQTQSGKVKLHRKNGVYTMRAWKPKPVFSRQGR